jgi:UDP-2,3-diacylglucosamine pyrophosphatase LpxH
MLVFISDIHLTDGTSGETINPRAFEVFSAQITELAKKRGAKSFQLVLLGDIFDLIRSEKWIKQEKIRPWSKKSPKQKAVVMDILNKILTENEAILASIRGILPIIRNNGCSKASITYLMGNHDWIINRYPQAREAVRKALGHTGDELFQWTPLVDKGHHVIARHGDRYDPINYIKEKGRDASSMGDAIVIELLNCFPRKCAEALNLAEDDPIIEQLRNIDNVRPHGAIPAWVMSITGRMPDGEAQKVREVFVDLYEAFVKNDFVQSFDTWNPFDLVDKMELGVAALRVTGGKLSVLDKLGAIVPSEAGKPLKDPFVRGAITDLAQHSDINYAVFGHTHGYRLLPLDRRAVSEKTNDELIYFNTGTWRKSFQRTIINPHDHEFVGYHVITHTTFYSKEDKTDRNYEVWHGALG